MTADLKNLRANFKAADRRKYRLAQVTLAASRAYRNALYHGNGFAEVEAAADRLNFCDDRAYRASEKAAAAAKAFMEAKRQNRRSAAAE